MAKLIKTLWSPRYEGLSRRDRLGGTYEAYAADPLQGWQFTMPADVAAEVSDAERDILELQASGDLHASLEGMARFLLRAESVSSSHIEGLSAAARRLARAELALGAGRDPSDQVAAQILSNVHAMERAVDLGAGAETFTLDHLLELHRQLMSSSPAPEIGGQIRETQNWIGGSSHNPCHAAFVPPPPELVPDLLADLIEYMRGDAHSPLTQAAVAHAQFETIHPFADGNGRVGRALIHVILRRRGLISRFVPPISLVLATWSTDYVAGLMGFRHIGAAAGAGRSEAASDWIRMFAAATRRACSDAGRYSQRMEEMSARWRAAAAPVRRNSAVDVLLRFLPGTPILTVEGAADLTGRSRARANDAVNTLVEAGVLVQRNVGRERYRVFEAPDVLDLFTGLERQLASSTGDTHDDRPSRPVPARPLTDQ